MKNLILKNWPLKILALFFAFVVWFVVIKITDPQISKTFEIPIEFINDEVLAQNGQVAHIVGDQTMTVRVEKARSIITSLSEDDFSAVADYSKMYRDTQVPVKVTSLSDKVLDSEIEQEALSVEVSLENLQTVSKVIEYETTGKPATGYVVGSVTIDPASVSVTCPESYSQYVNRAVVEINVSDMNETSTVSAELKLYDGNGETIEVGTNNISWDSTGVVECKVELLQVQTVIIDAEVSDTDRVADGFIYAGYTVSPAKLTLSGLRNNISSVTSVVINDISARGLNAPVEREIDVRKYLPEGVEVYKDSTIVKVTLNVEEIAEKEITVPASAIKMENLHNTYNAQVSDSVTVTVRGPESVVQAMTASDITASVNLDGLGKGVHKVTVRCSFASEYVSVVERKNVTVTVTSK